MFLCPLCGRQVSLKRYDPSDYEDDVIGITLRGLGRSRGFEEIERYSLLETDDPVLDKLAKRVTILMPLLVGPVIDADEAARLCAEIEKVVKSESWNYDPADSPWEALKERVLLQVYQVILRQQMERDLCKIDADEIVQLCAEMEKRLGTNDWNADPGVSPWEALKERVLWLSTLSAEEKKV